MVSDVNEIKVHNTSYNNALRASILGAKKRVYITSYVAVMNRKKKTCPTNKIFTILLSKLTAGLDIRWIIDHPRKHKTNYHSIKYLIRRLQENKIPFWIAPPRNTLHSKVILIDDATVFLGSHNLTRSSFENPLEVTVQIDSIKVCKNLTAWFEGLCNNPLFVSFPAGDYPISDIYP